MGPYPLGQVISLVKDIFQMYSSADAYTYFLKIFEIRIWILGKKSTSTNTLEKVFTDTFKYYFYKNMFYLDPMYEFNHLQA